MQIKELKEKIDFLIKNSQTVEEKVKSSLTEKKYIILTGANGFLGVYLTNELLKKNKNIIFLIRNDKQKKFIQYLLDNENFKIFNINKKIKKEELLFFSYEENDLNKIINCYSLELIIHCAAQLNNLYSLSQLYDSNVKLTFKLFEKFSHIPFHYISTLSVFASSEYYKYDDKKRRVLINEKTDITEELYGGYAQTKFMSDYLISKYHQQGFVYRLDLITPPFHKNLFTENELKNHFDKSLLKIVVNNPFKKNKKIYKNILVSMNPVDMCAKKIITSIFLNKKHTNIANIIGNDISLYDIIKSLENNRKIQKNHNVLLNEKINYIVYKNTFYKNYLNNLSNKKKEKLFNLNLFQTTGFKWKSLYLTNNNFDKYFYLKKLILLLKERSYA